MVISEDTVCKVTRGSITSVAIHPSEMRTLVAAGAKYGQVGLWDLVSYYFFEDTEIRLKEIVCERTA